jgi:mRNA-degrading endonuclease RelE of RelBE toxin-antitoxin system
MEFRIADTFTDSLAKLTGDEQKLVKTTAFDLQMNPANPGMSFHKLDRAKDPNFWSVRVGRDLRLIVHKTDSSLMLCHVNHHDAAYRWAERRKLQTHPKTGAAQLVEIRERVEEIRVPRYVEETVPASPKPRLFARVGDDELLGYGVPEEWLADVREANEETILELADHLPGEAAEALLEIATGGKPRPVQPPPAGKDPFQHPDAQRRFRVLSNLEELERALDYPWEKWTVFLHPEQRDLVQRDYKGPARVSGSAGTGKTIVALHRAVYLARSNPDSRVLLTTFSDALANVLKTKLRRLVSNEPRIAERLEVHSMHSIGVRLYERNVGKARLVEPATLAAVIESVASEVEGHSFSQRFLLTEWQDVVDAWQLRSWEAYRGVKRLGRKTRLSAAQRETLWAIFQRVWQQLESQELITEAELFTRLAETLREQRRAPFDFAVVDEAQDIAIAQLRFLAALAGDNPNGLYFAGDLGQRIFQQPFSWKSLGVDIRGRSRTLKVNYRTSHQIRSQADRLLGQEIADVDGNKEERRGTVSVFNGPRPLIQIAEDAEDEQARVARWLEERVGEGVQYHEIGVFVRSLNELQRAIATVEQAGMPYKVLDEHVEIATGHVSLSTMHLAKGLEFRAVAVMACDDEVIPSQERIERVADEADLAEVYDTERHLLYVACTRARDFLLVSGADPVSEFVDDLHGWP